MRAVPGLPRPPRSRALTGLLLAMLVQGAWLMLLLSRTAAPGGKPDEGPALLVLRLLAAAPAARPAPAAVRGPTSLTAAPRPLRSLPEAMTAPNGATPPTPVSAAAAAGVAASAPLATAMAPLRLALPPERAASGPRRPSMLSQMLNDPRSHSGKRTVEWAIADAAGTLPVTVQAATDGTNSTLIRQGSKCIRVAEARIKTLNPMDESSKGAPAAVGPCVTN